MQVSPWRYELERARWEGPESLEKASRWILRAALKERKQVGFVFDALEDLVARRMIPGRGLAEVIGEETGWRDDLAIAPTVRRLAFDACLSEKTDSERRKLYVEWMAVPNSETVPFTCAAVTQRMGWQDGVRGVLNEELDELLPAVESRLSSSDSSTWRQMAGDWERLQRVFVAPARMRKRFGRIGGWLATIEEELKRPYQKRDWLSNLSVRNGLERLIRDGGSFARSELLRLLNLENQRAMLSAAQFTPPGASDGDSPESARSMLKAAVALLSRE